MTNTGTLQVTTRSSRKVAMTSSMLSEMVVALFQARCECGPDAVCRHATAWRRFIKQRVGLEGRT
jgi:predicted NodU family carbamoyl transferase